MIVLSILLHGLFFSGVLFFPEFHFRKNDFTSVVEIDLVSLPAAPPAQNRQTTSALKPPKSEPVKIKKAAEKPIKKSQQLEATEAEAVPVSPSQPVRVKRSLKKKTFNASKAINKAIASLEKKASESRPQSVREAIDKLKKQQKTTAAEASAVGGIGETTKRQLELLDIYNAEIWSRIRKNWAFSQALAGNQENLEAVVIVKIMRDGEIRDVYFETKAGVRYFDESVMKAIKKSNPLPPLPEGFLRPFYDVGLRFNLSELQRRP